MKEIKDICIKTYGMGEGFRIEIITIGTTFPNYEAWLYHEDYGVKTFMLGTSFSDIDEFMEVVKENYEVCKQLYTNNYMGGDEHED